MRNAREQGTNLCLLSLSLKHDVAVYKDCGITL
jgi:hypothetical protein